MCIAGDFLERASDRQCKSQKKQIKMIQQQLTRSCVRLNSQLSSLSSLKHFGITREEVCGMILRLLGLLCATVEVRDAAGGGGGADPSAVGAAREGVERMDLGDDAPRRVTIRYEDVGYLIGGERGDDGGGSMLTIVERRERDGAPVRKCVLGGGPDREAEDGGPTDRPFALPPPARQALMSSILTLLGKKGTLRCVSNSAIYPDDGGGKRSLLVVHHRPLLRMLLRTAPYLDERACDRVPHEGSGQRSVTLKRTVTVIRSLRRFFDQGVQDSISLGGEAPGGAVALSDATARSVWSSVESDVSRTHSNGCFRALIVVYLFHPSRCSASYYLSVLPLWMEAWRQIDRCPEWDHLWLVLFSRARKYLPPGSYDWTGLLRHLLTHCGYWLQIPTGGASSTDRSFPRAVSPAKRTCPARLKAFVGSEGKYEEGMDFVGRLTKMIMFCAGPGKGVAVAAAGGGDGGPASTAAVSEGSAVTLRFLSFVTPYFNPSNVGAWTFPLGAFLHYLAYELCHRVGNAAGLRTLRADHPETYDRLMADEPYLEGLELPGNEVVAFLDRLLPLCQQVRVTLECVPSEREARVSHLLSPLSGLVLEEPQREPRRRDGHALPRPDRPPPGVPAPPRLRSARPRRVVREPEPPGPRRALGHLAPPPADAAAGSRRGPEEIAGHTPPDPGGHRLQRPE